MGIRETSAIIVCKTATKILRLMGRGGTAIPGKLALKLCPGLLGYVSKDVRCVVITGTNGKTTSARMVEEIFAKSGELYFANRSGANLINGITAEFVEHSTLSGKPKTRFALIEVDEAASKEVCRFLDPRAVLVTNVFRDQLDRFGDISYTLESILTGIKNSPNAVVCLNADCSLLVSIAEKIPNQIVYFGVDVPIYVNPIEEISDASRCIKCKHEYEYSHRTFGHLGGFYCPNCGYCRPERQVAALEILDMGFDSTTIRAKISDEETRLVINLPGGYNIYNAVGSLAVAEAMGLPRQAAVSALGEFDCGFGRMEQFDMGKCTARMILVKNPAGCNQVLNYLSSLTQKHVFVCCLNDKAGDGTDISWIWDVNFERLAELNDKLSRVFVCGMRRADMALRLKYAGIPLEKMRIVDDYDRLITEMSGQELPVVIMPTYSAMMELREKMSAAFGGKDFWE